MDRSTCDLGQNDFAHQTTHTVAAQGQDDCAQLILHGADDLFVLTGQMLTAANDGLFVAGQEGELLAQRVQQSGTDDSEDVADSQDDDGEAVEVCSGIAGDGLIDIAQGNGTSAIAAAHDGQDILHNSGLRVNTDSQTSENTKECGHSQTTQNCRDIANKALEQDILVQSQNRTCNQEDDIDLQQVDVITGDDAVDVLQSLFRDDVEELQQCGTKEGHQQTTADVIIPDGKPLTQLVQDNAQTERGAQRTRKAAGLDAQIDAGHADEHDCQCLPPRQATQPQDLLFFVCHKFCFFLLANALPCAGAVDDALTFF